MKNKYFAKKTNAGDSKAEIRRYNELLLMEKAGVIKNIIKQPQFILQEGFRYKNERAYPQMKYTADFQYFDIERNVTVIEEVKSSYTAKLTDYRLRSRLFKYQIKDKTDLLFIEIIK